MNRKYLPLILMLVAGAVTSIITFAMKYTVIQKLVALLLVLVIFYLLGSVLKWALDIFDTQNEKAALDKGEVIEKDKTAEASEQKTEKE
ncbi:MAG: hypothetical protein UFG06_00510 [Lachnospiraceae bacterium]|nr:hypothetical protein [Lachnospiraceae bacterium]